MKKEKNELFGKKSKRPKVPPPPDSMKDNFFEADSASPANVKRPLRPPPSMLSEVQRKALFGNKKIRGLPKPPRKRRLPGQKPPQTEVPLPPPREGQHDSERPSSSGISSSLLNRVKRPLPKAPPPADVVLQGDSTPDQNKLEEGTPLSEPEEVPTKPSKLATGTVEEITLDDELQPFIPPPPEEDPESQETSHADETEGDGALPLPPPKPQVEKPKPIDEPVKGIEPDVKTNNVAVEPTESFKFLHVLRGKLVVTLLETENVRPNVKSVEKSGTMDMFLTIALGGNEKNCFKDPQFQSQNSKVLKNKSKNALLDNHELCFFVKEVQEMLQNEKLILRAKIFKKSLFSDTLVGEASFSLLDIFSADDKFLQIVESQVVVKQGKRFVPNGNLRVQLNFMPVRLGYFVLTCRECKDLKKMDIVGKNDPYCQLTFGRIIRRGQTVQNGGSSCSFRNEKLSLYVGKNTFTDPVTFSIYDADLGKDDLIGSLEIDIFRYSSNADGFRSFMSQGVATGKDAWSTLFNKGKETGKVKFHVEYMPAGVLSIHVKEGKHMTSQEYISRQDPFVQLTLKGQLISYEKKTKVIKKGGENVNWDEVLTFTLVDHHEVIMKVFDEDFLNDNDLIGQSRLSLLPVYRYGEVKSSIKIKKKDKWGKIKTSGEIFLDITFDGPLNVPFPQNQPAMDSFDHSERKNVPVEETERPTEEPCAVAGSEAAKPEFTEEEIENSFDFLDLDKNGYIGFKELRHTLVCLGQHVTDEEISEMLAMLDSDGDGQVSISEFRLMMLHPNPGSNEFNINISKSNTNEPKINATEKKKKTLLLQTFCKDKRIVFEDLEDYSKRLLNRVKPNPLIGFDVFCELLQIEPSSSYEVLFKLFEIEGEKETINFKSFLMSLLSFIDLTKESKAKFTFKLFDNDKNGFLDEEELLLILKGTHLSSSNKLARRKLEKIKRFTGSGDSEFGIKISLTKFQELSRKFPNIIFPSNS
eukprot:snap_masked-scaffold_2-processed-gene-7.51-mRNA-1 protein AED:0.23 eAED:0.26 QI:0/0/0/1/1/1/2/0/979